MTNTININFYNKETCAWRPEDLSNKIKELISSGTIDENNYFLNYTEFVPSPDGGKTISEGYVRGGLCIIQFCKNEIEPDSLVSMGKLANMLNSEKTRSECGEDEGIAAISYKNRPTAKKDDIFLIRI